MISMRTNNTGTANTSSQVRLRQAAFQSTCRSMLPSHQPPSTHIGSAMCVSSQGIFSPATV